MPLSEFNCDWCGCVSYKSACRLKRYKHHFCSSECMRLWLVEFQSGFVVDLSGYNKIRRLSAMYADKKALELMF